MKANNEFDSLPIGRLITKMSVPVIATMLFQALYNVVDSLFVAQLGLGPLTALGLANPIQMVMISLSNGIGVGMNAVVSQRMGANDTKGAARAAGNAITLGLVCYLIMLVFGVFGTNAFFGICTADADIMKLGVEYLSICCIFSFGMFFSIIGQRMLQVAGQPTWSMIVHLMGCIFNIVFDPILIFGYLGFPAMGVTGAAIATVGGQILSAIAAFVVCAVKKKGVSFTIHDLKPSSYFTDMCKVGIPAAIATGISSVMSFCMNQILKAEVIGIAVFTVFYKLWCFVTMPVTGLVQGTIPIMGYNYGAKNKERVARTVKLSIIIGIVMMAVVTALFEVFAGQLVLLFDNGKNDAAFLPAGIQALRIIAVVFVPFGSGQVCSNIFQGMGNGKPSLIFALLHQCILLLPAAWLLLRFGGLSTVWYSYWFAEIVSAGIIYFVFRNEYKKTVEKL